MKARIPGGWRQNALRHSFISYRVAETGDVARTALEAGNSPKMIFRHYREVVDEEAAKAWFSITPPDGWQPQRTPVDHPRAAAEIPAVRTSRALTRPTMRNHESHHLHAHRPDDEHQ